MPEEIKITGTFNTSEIESGAERVKASADEMRAALDKAFELKPGQAEKLTEQAEKAAEDMTAGFLKKMLIRDVIKSVVSGIGETIKEIEKNLNNITGFKIDLNGWKAWGDILTQAALSISAFNRAGVANMQSKIQGLKDEEKMRLFLEHAEERPASLGISTAQIERNIRNATRQQYEDKINNAQYNLNDAKAGQELGPMGMVRRKYALGSNEAKQPGANITDSELVIKNKENEAYIKTLREELVIAKRRDSGVEKMEKEDAERTKKKWREDDARAKRMQTELDRSIERSEADYRRAEKAVKAKEKREEEAELSRKVIVDEAKKKGAHDDLSADEYQLKNLKPTSLTKIGGQIFGGNSGAEALVKDAAKQVALLNSIDAELKAIRKERIELTLR